MSKAKQITVPVHVPLTKLAGLLCAAFEGGTNYWCLIASLEAGSAQCPAELVDDWVDFVHCWLPLTKAGLPLHDQVEDQPIGRLTLQRITAALPAFLATRQGREFLAGEDDAECGDVFVQIAMFGEVIYG